MKKGIITFFISFLFITVIMPFSISAATVSGNAPILGVNIYLVNDDMERYNSTASSSLTVDLNGDSMEYWSCMSYSSSSGACNVWKSANSSGSTTPATGGYSGTISIPANLFTDNATQHAYLYEYEFVFDDSYVGNILFENSFAQGGYTRYFVNGSHLTIYSSTLTTSFNIIEYTLERNYHENWYFPIESFNIINSAFTNNLNQVGLTKMSDYLFPIFQLKQNDILHTVYAGTSYTFIFKFYSNVQINNLSQISNYLSVSNGQFTKISNINTFIWNGQTARLYTVEISNFTSGGNININYIGPSDRYYMPIYFNTPTYKAISTDFALQFGLSNDLLDNLSIIANGTNISNQSSSDLNNSNNQFNDNANDYMAIEDTFNSDFNDSMNSINTNNNNLNQFGSGFINSAQWVRNQFDTLTENNIYGQILGFSLLVGISLLILGRWFG